jgi:hypothetical protein
MKRRRGERTDECVLDMRMGGRGEEIRQAYLFQR